VQIYELFDSPGLVVRMMMPCSNSLMLAAIVVDMLQRSVRGE
jgi:hypothetical protein